MGERFLQSFNNKADFASHVNGLEHIVKTNRPDITPFVDLYKQIHMHPELSGLESQTAARLTPYLEDLGLEVHTGIGGHGVAATFRNGPGRTILLRAETDGLPIEETTGLPYASKVRMKDTLGQEQPVSHACGHDIHIACVMATLRLLHSSKRSWSGTVVAVFQPDEETPSGAQAMIDGGLYKLIPVPDLMLAQHVGGSSKAGTVGVRTGSVLPASDYFNIHLRSSGLGPNPAEGPEPVSVASYLLTRYQRTISLEKDSNAYATLVCRDFQAGEPGALFTNEVHMRLEIKTCEIATRDKIIEAMKSVTSAEVEVFNGNMQVSYQVMSRAPVTKNNTELAEALQQVYVHHFGSRFWKPPMDKPVEDFSILGAPSNTPFVYWKLGCTEPAKYDKTAAKGGNILEHLPTNHSPAFAPYPELTISTGLDAMALAALYFLEKG